MTRHRDRIKYYYQIMNVDMRHRSWEDDATYTHPEIRVWAEIKYGYVVFTSDYDDGKLHLHTPLFTIRSQAHRYDGARCCCPAYGDRLEAECRYWNNMDLAFKILRRIQKHSRISFESTLQEMIRIKATRVIYDDKHSCYVPYRYRKNTDMYFNQFKKEAVA